MHAGGGASGPGRSPIVLRAPGLRCPRSCARAGRPSACAARTTRLTLSCCIEAAQLPLAAPSANPSGAPSPKTADDVLAYFDGQIDGRHRRRARAASAWSPRIVDLSPHAIPHPALRRRGRRRCVRMRLCEKMHIVGITGGTGCGKTTALMELRAPGRACDRLRRGVSRAAARPIPPCSRRSTPVFRVQ